MKKLFFLSALAVSFITNSQNIYPTTGNVGFGTTTPTEELEVVGTIKGENIVIEPQVDGFIAQFGNLLSSNKRNFNFSKNTSSNRFDFYICNPNSIAQFDVSVKEENPWVVFRDYAGSEIFKISRNETLGSFLHLPKPDSRVVIAASGDYLISDGHKLIVKDGSAMIEGNILTTSNIGIGTTSFTDGPDTYRLSVNGKVRANAIKVYTDWADFVFEEDYKLPTLEEVEAHIKLNGHLIDIPSAEEVEKNGIELGQMNKLLLQKIEELTLYTIELKKEIELINDKMNKNEN